MGRPHSGSTVLSALLGQLPRTRAVGELHRIEDERLSGELPQRCSCGRVQASCPFWRGVRERFVSGQGATGTGGETWGRFLASLRHFTRSAHMLRLPLLDPARAPAAELVDGLGALYDAIADEAGADTVVDASRNPFVAGLLLRARPDARVLHLVRHGEDSLYSKLRRLQEGRGFRWYRYHWRAPRAVAPLLALSGLSWVALNGAAEALGAAHGDRVLRVRYEDLCADPGGTLARIGAFLDRDAAPLAARLDAQEPIACEHLIGGNGLRLAGAFVFRPDAGKPLPWRHRALFRLYAWPLLLRYGYLGARGAP